MSVKVALRFHPFSHTPGVSCLLPGSFWKITAFPTRILLDNLYGKGGFTISLALQGPMRDFTLVQDLEKGVVRLFGESQKGYFRLVISRLETGIQLFFEKTPEEGLSYQIGGVEERATPKTVRLIPLEREHPIVTPPKSRLSLGIHKAQDWDLIMRRGDLQEIAPFWIRLAEWLPEIREDKRVFGALKLLEPRLALLKKAFLVGFSGILVPTLQDDLFLGILAEEKIPEDLSPLHFLKQGASILRSLFFEEKEGEVALLPLLPREFYAGRFVHLALQNGGFLDLEWSKEMLRRVVIHPHVSQKIKLSLPKKIRRFRLKRNPKERGKTVHCDELVSLNAGESVYLDRFEG